MAARILLTGATGTLGSYVLRRLVGEGVPVVCLTRSQSQEGAEGRIASILAQAGGAQARRGDLRESFCGLSDEDRSALRGTISSIVHIAASIDFLDDKAAFSTNVDGVRNMLALADDLAVPRIDHVSTVYLAGDAPRFTEDDVHLGQSWRNAYELSKFEGEALVRDWARGPDRHVTILRPSIIVGGADGSIPSFDALYTYLKPFALLARSMRRRKSSLPDGIAVSLDGIVTLPIAVSLPEHGTLNLVPLDWVAEALVQAVKRPAQNATFHLVHPNPAKVRWILDHALRFLGIDGVRVVSSPEAHAELAAALPPVLARIQKSVDAVLGPFEPYTSGQPVFTADRLREAFGHALPPPFPIDGPYLTRTLAFAESVGWNDARAVTGGSTQRHASNTGGVSC